MARRGRSGRADALVSVASRFCFIGALKNTSVAPVSIIYATLPIAAAGPGIWSCASGPRPRRWRLRARRWQGRRSMVGVGGDGHWTGGLKAVGMVLGGAGMIVTTRASPAMPTLVAVAVWAPVASPAVAPWAQRAGQPAQTRGLLAALGLVKTTLSLARFIIGSRHLPAVRTVLLPTLETPMIPLWVWLAFTERPSGATLAGGAVVFAAVVWYVVHEGRAGDRAPP